MNLVLNLLPSYVLVSNKSYTSTQRLNLSQSWIRNRKLPAGRAKRRSAKAYHDVLYWLVAPLLLLR